MARNVRRYRQERNMSLGELGRRSGLSKQTLSKLEQGVGNPTVETLTQLGAALGIPVRKLVTEWGTTVFVQRQGQAAVDVADGQLARTLGEVYGTGYVRFSVLDLDRSTDRGADAADTAKPGPPGTLHHLYVISGKLKTGPLIEPVSVAAGDFVRFPGDVPYRHECLSTHAVAHLVTTIPQLRQLDGGA